VTSPAPAARRSFPPPQRLHVLELATREDPATAGCPAGSWSLDDLALALLREAHDEDLLRARLAAAAAAPMSRSTIARVLAEADLKPHKSAYWLASHDPDFGAKSQDLCRLYLDAPRLWQLGELVLCTDEKTGILIRRRKHPTLPARPGEPRRREFEYVRLGSTHLTASFCVPTGQVAYDLTRTHNGADFAAHLRHATEEVPGAERYHWVVDNNRTHSTPGVCAAVAELSGLALPGRGLETGRDRRAWLSDPGHRHVFHFTPVHGSWLNQVELFFGVLSRRLLARDDFASAEAFLGRLREWLEYYNRELAHPYRWTYAGAPLVRDTPFERTRRQQKRGRAFASPRPSYHQRLFYPPRPYHKAVPA
jgi:transposase